jgi:hypothetical protein
MENIQFWALIGMMGAGFGWMIIQMRGLDARLNNLETRITVVETILSMMGMPLKDKK